MVVRISKKELLTNIKDNNLIRFQKTTVPYADDPFRKSAMNFTASVYIADYEYTSATVEDRKFMVNNVEFSEDQIIEAIKNTFSQYLI